MAALVSSFWARSARAQLTIPDVAAFGTARSTLSPSAAEAEYHVMVQQAALNSAITFRQERYPVDSIRGVVATTGARWLGSLHAAPVRGIQLDPASHVAAVARQYDDANAQITTRLATPGLPFADRAFTYLTAVRAFTDVYAPDRLSTAEAYAKRLDALGDSAAFWQFQAHQGLADAYYFLGKSAEVIRHGMRAIHLVGTMAFIDRGIMFSDGGSLYAAIADALTGQAAGRDQLARINTQLRAAIVPPQALVAKDTAFLAVSQTYQRALQDIISVGLMLGTPGARITSNYWLNRPRGDTASIAVNDGKIRVLEVGEITCNGCMEGLQGLRQLRAMFPQVEMVLLTWTSGSWGNRLVEPDEAVAVLEDYYLHKAKIPFPIAIWKTHKARNEDGGITPENLGPNVAHYPILVKPMFWVLDGKGTVRHVFLGYSRQQKIQLARTLQFLESEARVGAS